MRIATCSVSFHQLALGLALSFAAACAANSDESTETPSDLTALPDPGGTPSTMSSLAQAAEAVQAYGRLATENASLMCSTANGELAAIPLTMVSGVGSIWAGGVAASGTVTLDGAIGHGGFVAGAASTWNASTQTFDLAAGIVGQMVLPVSGSVPTDETDANAMFDEAFGSAARYGINLANELEGPLGRELGFYGIAPITLTGPDGNAVSGAILAVGVIKDIDGRLVAVQTTGIGGFAQFVE